MHLLFTKEELECVDTSIFGWPIKDLCPQSIRESIEHKKELLNSQMKGGVPGGNQRYNRGPQQGVSGGA